MKKMIFAVITASTVVAHAQVNSSNQSNWKFPTNIQGICRNIEQSLVQIYKLEIENNRTSANEQLPETQRREASMMAEAARKSLRLDEERWFKLGCINLVKN